MNSIYFYRIYAVIKWSVCIYMSNNSWKQYGGTLVTETVNKFRAGVLVADELLLRQKYSGEFEVLGGINVLGDVTTDGNLLLKTAEPNNIIRFDVSSSMSVHMDAYLREKLYMGTLSDYIVGGANGIGLNTQTPSGTFEIVGNTTAPYNFIAGSGAADSNVIITRNVNDKGLLVSSSDVSSGIHFFNDTAITSGNAANSSIIYDSATNNITFRVPKSVEFSGETSEDTFPAIYRSTAVTNTVINSNPIVTGDISASVALNLASNNSGASFIGGDFPTDPSNSFGMIAAMNKGTKHAAYTFVTSDDPSINAVRSGINNYSPDPSFTITMNGKTRVGHSEQKETASFDAIAKRIVNDFDATIAADRKVKYFTGGPVSQTGTDYNYGIFENTNYGIGDWTFTQFTSSDVSSHVLSVSSPVHFTSTVDSQDNLLKIAGHYDNRFYYYNTTAGQWHRSSNPIPRLVVFPNLTAGADYKYIETTIFNDQLFVLVQEQGGTVRGIFCPTEKCRTTAATSLFYSTDDIFIVDTVYLYEYTLLSGLTIHNTYNIGQSMYILSNTALFVITYDVDPNNAQSVTTLAQLQANEYYAMYKGDANYYILVGNNVISYTTDGATTWNDITVSDITAMNGETGVIRNAEITSSSGSLLDEITLIGDNVVLTHTTGRTNINVLSDWKRHNVDEVNGTSYHNSIISSTNTPIDIHKMGSGFFSVINNMTPSTYSEGDIQTKCTAAYQVYAPTIHDGDKIVLDILGDIRQSGATYQF